MAVKILKVAVAFAFLAAIGWLGWVFFDNVREAEPSIKAGLIGFLSVISVAVFAHYQTKNREINARLFAEKRDGYMHMIDLIFELVRSQKTGGVVSEEILVEKMMDFKKALIIWGGPNVIEAWNGFEMKSADGLSAETVMVEMEKILRSIRKDLGHNDSLLKFGNLSGLLLIAEDKNMILRENLDA